MGLTLQFSSSDASASGLDVLALGVTEQPLSKQPVVAALDRALGGALEREAKVREFEGKIEQTLELSTLGAIAPARVVLVGLGPEAEQDAARARAGAALAVRVATTLNARTLGIKLPEPLDFRALAEGVGLGAYRFTKYLTAERLPKSSLKKVTLFSKARAGTKEKKAAKLGLHVADAVSIARDAVNEPPNELYPAVMAELARSITKKHGMKIKVLDKAGIKKHGMLLHYAVGQGSAHDPRFIHMTYTPAGKAKKRLVFVGKGLTFDSGGLCIKPAPGMGEMKSDMGGAAAVLGLMAAVGHIKPKVEVHGIIGSAENMPDAAAYRPGDVFGSLDGKTVEIINTDAEGRLVLADALAYARALSPTVLIDAATLTGACVVALGKTCSAFYTAEEKLAEAMNRAAREAGENFWRMPLLEELVEQLQSDVADLKHTGERWGGSITAALFLREFVGDAPWIHCDVAGPVLADRARGTYPKGGTGHAVLTFLRFVENS